ncbi:hypothetical protein E2C01_070834 [Portunus trituberculatus]|uniref:Uncharacterized protein n=1 Tax=Portunus trituberculatus TaxID=210409 RepID=A0A5B7I2Q0_PORTR|nr:hypothetical protein [Portunus trituberculatus]
MSFCRIMTDKAKTAAAKGVSQKDLRHPHTSAYAHRHHSRLLVESILSRKRLVHSLSDVLLRASDCKREAVQGRIMSESVALLDLSGPARSVGVAEGWAGLT